MTTSKVFFIRIDLWEGTSGTSLDVPRFGLKIYIVSNAIGSKILNKIIVFRLTPRFLAKIDENDFFPWKNL